MIEFMFCIPYASINIASRSLRNILSTTRYHPESTKSKSTKVYSKRNTFSEKFRNSKIMSTDGDEVFKKFDIEKDGNCLFRSVSLFLNKTQEKHKILRNESSKFIFDNWDHFKIFTCKENSQSDDVVYPSKEEYYLNMSKDGVYGTSAECLALSEIHSLNFYIYTQSQKPQRTKGQAGRSSPFADGGSQLDKVSSNQNKDPTIDYSFDEDPPMLERKEEDEALDRIINPITEPLREFVEKTVGRKVQVKHEKVKLEAPKTYFESEPKLPRNVEFQPTEIIAQTSENLISDDDDDDDDDGAEDVFYEPLQHLKEDLQKSIHDRSGAYEEFLDQYPKVAQEYVDRYYKQSDEIDHSYGLKHDMKTDDWSMGSQKVNFLPNGDIKVGAVSYKGTQGLYDLLFLKKPIYQTEDDKLQFTDILNRTNVHRRDFDPSKQVKGSTSSKYRQFVKPLVSSSSEAKRLKSRKKYLALKLERKEEDEALDRIINPVTEPLREVVEKTVGRKVQVKHENVKLEAPKTYFESEPKLPRNVVPTSRDYCSNE
ncbi:unnamed protein product [Ceutorhynchus assimilis]|uniref:OTU domain-containing protein n=1 Tax=Ceutorhynchus assimilis TaxID=467358 RepID=A0A9N9M9Q6_9CUCU|nr:unnamed protein product [Ceutorhynchus assimilis]